MNLWHHSPKNPRKETVFGSAHLTQHHPHLLTPPAPTQGPWSMRGDTYDRTYSTDRKTQAKVSSLQMWAQGRGQATGQGSQRGREWSLGP